MATNIDQAQVPLKGQIAPQSVAAAGTATSGWVHVGDFINLITVIVLGALGGGSVALTFDQAQDGAGSGAKPLAFTGGSSATNNATMVVDNNPDQIDKANGFTHVRAKLTVTGGTGALVAGALFGASPRFTS